MMDDKLHRATRIKLSVVIPCYNGAQTIGAQLEALAGQECSEPWEVIVVNNRSDDDTVQIVGKYVGRVRNLRIVDALERQGRPYARNVGVEAANGESIVFCDADDVVGEGWLAAMATALSRFDCVACRVDFMKLNEPALAQQHAFHDQHHGLQKIWYPPYLEHAGGGTMGVKRALHSQVGGFDEAFPVLEDTEYCFRIQEAGCRIEWVPDAVLHIRCRPNEAARFQQVRQSALYNMLLAKRYQQQAVGQFHSWGTYLKNSVRLIESLPHVRPGLAWNRWVWYLGWQVGVLHGSFKFNRPPLSLPFPPEGWDENTFLGRLGTRVSRLLRHYHGEQPANKMH